MMNATLLQAHLREVRGSENHIRAFQSRPGSGPHYEAQASSVGAFMLNEA